MAVKAPRSSAVPTGPSHLTPRQADILRILTDRLIPPQDDAPGGADGGALAFILAELSPPRGALSPYLSDYRLLLDTLDRMGFAGLGPAAQDEMLTIVENDGAADGPDASPNAVRRAFLLAAEHAQEGYWTSPASWPAIGFAETG
jgi:hypothetical protein